MRAPEVDPRRACCGRRAGVSCGTPIAAANRARRQRYEHCRKLVLVGRLGAAVERLLLARRTPRISSERMCEGRSKCLVLALRPVSMQFLGAQAW
jgi:hypothetical protein